MINAFVIANRPWPWSQWTILFLAALTHLSISAVQETHTKTLLRRRRKLARIIPSITANQPAPHLVYFQSWLKSIPLVRPVQMLFVEPVVMMLSLYIAFTFAVVYCFSTSIPYSFSTVYNFTPEAQGLVFISLIIGYVLSAPTMVIPYLRQQQAHARADSNVEGNSAPIAPERLLFPAMIGSVGLPISFFWFAWSARPDVHWICPVVALGLFSWGNDLVYVSSGRLTFSDIRGLLPKTDALNTERCTALCPRKLWARSRSISLCS